MTAAATDWNEVARTMGRDMAVTFFKNVPMPLTTENVQAGLKPAAAAALIIFQQISDDIGGPEAVDALAAVVLTQMIESINEVLSAQGEVRH